MRALLLAAVTGGAAFGLLVAIHPIGGPAQAPAVIGTPEADAFHTRIDAARDALRQTEAAIAALSGQPSVAASTHTAQLDAQIAATRDRHDLVQRQAKAIRDALKPNADVSALAEIRDSAVVGQLLSQLSSLDATIAEQGARFKPNHPTMRGLAARRTALLAQIKVEAANIAAALESEAKLDEAQLKQLQSMYVAAPATPDTQKTRAALEARAAAQGAELDTLMDSYLGLPPSATAPRSDPILGALSPLDLLVAGVAALAALAASLGLALPRHRLRGEAELVKRHRDHNPEFVAAVAGAVASPPPAPALRRAS